MKTILKRTGMLFVALAVMLSCVSLPALAAPAEPAAESSRVAAFPGAEGGGMWATGARGAEKPEVYHVTSLADSGEGSFRDAVSKGNRIVVFDVSGYIDLDSNVNISHDNMTILGQTAPGDGICFRGNNIKVGGDNVILRYLRFRVGSKLKDGSGTKAQDGLEVPDNGNNIIIDHCSVSWGTDENLAAYAVKNLTVQYSIISEALNRSVHDKGEHGYAAIWGGVNMTVHHNLIATHKSRNPKIGTSETTAMTDGYIDDQTLVDIRNNVFYNWSDKAGYGAENGADVNIINNYYKAGPATGYDVKEDASGNLTQTFRPDKRSRIFELSPGNKYQSNWSGDIYASGNVIDDDSTDPTAVSLAAAVNADNWQIEKGTGIYLDASKPSYKKLDTPNNTYIDQGYAITTTTAEEAYNDVIENAGATLPKRDKVDERIISNVINRTAPSGSKGSIGLVDDPIDGVPEGSEAEYDDRGYPIFSNETRPDGYDADGDGIADSWEDAMGLNKADRNDSLKIGPGGYTWLEIFVEESIAGGKEPAGLALSAEDKYYKTTDTITVTAAEGGVAPSNSWVTSYENGIVTVDPSAKFDKAVAVAASYDSSNNLIDSKNAEVDKASGTANVGEVAQGAVTKVFLWSDLDAIEPLCEPYTVGAGSVSSGDITDVEIYCNDAPAAQAENIGGIWRANLTGLPTGNNILTAKAEMSDGSYSLSPIKTVHVIGAQEAEGWTADGEASFDGECYTLTSGSELSCEKSGDFKLVGRLEDFDEVGAGLTAYREGTNEGVAIIKTRDENYEPAIFYIDSLDVEIKLWAPESGSVDDYSLFEIERSGGKMRMYAGTSLADLERNLVCERDVTSDAFTVGSIMMLTNGTSPGAGGGNKMSVSKFSMLKLIETATSPKVELTNIKDNDRIDVANSTVEAKITADGAPVTEVWVYFNDAPIASLDTNITAEETVSIPITFSEPTAGTLTVYAFDDNLCRGSASAEVSVSMDSAPWILGDIGYVEGQPQTYAQVTPDYTFKLYSAPGGNIGGTSDRFGYMYQEFTGNNRVYYRSRLQSSSQFGVVFRKDLAPDGVEYYFGGDTDESGAITYKLMKRASKGAALELVEDVTSKTTSGQNLYFIAEKSGDKINIYTTENSNASVYTTKTPIISIDAPELGDTYLMGFAEAGRNADDFADSGWVALEAFDDDNTAAGWNLDNGLDWRWQIQESAPAPVWDGEETFGNSTGKMKITTDSDYTQEGYIIHEYLPISDRIVTGEADVLVSGENAGLNLYMNVGTANKAFKVSFSDDGKVYIGGTETDYSYTQQWYHVSMTYDPIMGGGNADVVVADASGAECAKASVPLVDFRSSENTKRAEITNAFYIEPFANRTAVYYIDDVSVDQTDPGVKVERETNWYTFKDVESLSGAFTVNGTTLPDGGELTGAQMNVASGAGSLATKGYDVAGVHFAKRIRLNKGKAGALTVPVKNGSSVYVYCASANSSAERSMFINGVEYKVKSGTALKYEYTGADGTIEIYATDGIDTYGVCVEKVTITPNN